MRRGWRVAAPLSRGHPATAKSLCYGSMISIACVALSPITSSPFSISWHDLDGRPVPSSSDFNSALDMPPAILSHSVNAGTVPLHLPVARLNSPPFGTSVPNDNTSVIWLPFTVMLVPSHKINTPVTGSKMTTKNKPVPPLNPNAKCHSALSINTVPAASPTVLHCLVWSLIPGNKSLARPNSDIFFPNNSNNQPTLSRFNTPKNLTVWVLLSPSSSTFSTPGKSKTLGKDVSAPAADTATPNVASNKAATKNRLKCFIDYPNPIRCRQAAYTNSGRVDAYANIEPHVNYRGLSNHCPDLLCADWLRSAHWWSVGSRLRADDASAPFDSTANAGALSLADRRRHHKGVATLPVNRSTEWEAAFGDRPGWRLLESMNRAAEARLVGGRNPFGVAATLLQPGACPYGSIISIACVGLSEISSSPFSISSHDLDGRPVPSSSDFSSALDMVPDMLSHSENAGTVPLHLPVMPWNVSVVRTSLPNGKAAVIWLPFTVMLVPLHKINTPADGSKMMIRNGSVPNPNARCHSALSIKTKPAPSPAVLHSFSSSNTCVNKILATPNSPMFLPDNTNNQPVP